MAIFHAPDNTPLFYRTYTPSSTPHNPSTPSPSRQPLTLVFLHGWPMSSRMFDQLIVPLVETHRFPVIAPDRRGFGSSHWSTPATGEVTFDTFVQDAVALLAHALQQTNPGGPFVFVAASMGCIESVLVRAASAVLKEACKGLVWLGPNMPWSLSCEECPGAPSKELWDGLIEGFRGPGSKDFIHAAIPGVFRTDLGNNVGEHTLGFFERLVAQADPVALERTVVLICQKEMVGELRAWAAAAAEEEKEKVPILILHGDSDGGMPLETSAAVVHEILPWSQLKVYEKAGHGKSSHCLKVDVGRVTKHEARSLLDPCPAGAGRHPCILEADYGCAKSINKAQ